MPRSTSPQSRAVSFANSELRKASFLGCLITLFCLAENLSTRADEPPPQGVPDGFVDLKALIPDIVIELRYFGAENFIGRQVAGYTANRCWLAHKAAEHLSLVQADLRPFGLGLKVFDAYRPQRAVDDFVRWVEDESDQVKKTEYYPDIQKRHLIRDGYIAARSGHSRGGTIDLTLVALASDTSSKPVELDMGSAFDHFGPISATAYHDLSAQQRANRLLLKTVMERHGFLNYRKEWWHFRLRNEPFPSSYFDFPTGGSPVK